MRSIPWYELGLLAVFCVLLLTACGGAGGTQPVPADESAAPASRPVTSEVARATLSGLRSLYQTRAQEIRAQAIDGNFRLAGEGQLVPADFSYSSLKIEALLDSSLPIATRLDAGADAVTVLIAGYRTTEMPQFALSARDILGYVRTVLTEEQAHSSVSSDFDAVRLTPLEKELAILETSCSCPR